MKAILSILVSLVLTGQGSLYSQAMNLKDIKFHVVAVPMGDSISVAYISDRDFKNVYDVIGGKEIAKEFSHPRLYETFLLENGFIAYKQYLDDGFLILNSKEEFWRFKDWKLYLSSGISWHDHADEIAYVRFNLKPAGVEALQAGHNWKVLPVRHRRENLYISRSGTEIIEEKDDEKQHRLFESDQGSILILHWPHFRSGEWYPSLKDYDTCAEWTSGD